MPRKRKRRCRDCSEEFRTVGEERRCWLCYTKLAHARYPQFLQELAKQDERRKLLERLLADRERDQFDGVSDKKDGKPRYDRVELNTPDPASILYCARRIRRVSIRRTGHGR